MATALLPHFRRPPPLYRLARGLRRVGLIVLVLLVLGLAVEVYSVSKVVGSSPGSSGFSAQFLPNETFELAGTFHVPNSGPLPITDFRLHLRLLDAAASYLGGATGGPITLAGGSNTSVPIVVYLPFAAGGAVSSLLTEDQTLTVQLWANGTYGYLFPAGIATSTTDTWGAPFANYQVATAAAGPGNGTSELAVTISYQNHAGFDEVGSLDFAVLSERGTTCGTGSLPVDVPAQGSFNEQQTVAIASGCAPAGGSVTAALLAPDDVVVPLPAEAVS